MKYLVIFLCPLIKYVHETMLKWEWEEFDSCRNWGILISAQQVSIDLNGGDDCPDTSSPDLHGCLCHVSSC